MSFVHLHVHSCFSVLDGMSRLEDLVDKALRCKMPAIALTDHGSMFGTKEFLDYVEKVKKGAKDKLTEEKITKEEFDFIQAFKPIVGVEAYCAARSLRDKDKDKKIFIARKNREMILDRSGFHLILLAKNHKGYQNLCKLVSVSYIEGFYAKPRIDKEILKKHSEGLIVCSACLGGEIPQLILNDEIEKAEETVRWFKEVFGDDYYLEVQLHKPTRADIPDDVYREQLKVNASIYEIAAKTGVKVVATNDIHFVEAEHADAHERLVCVSTGRKISDKDRMLYTKEEYMKSSEQMKEMFADHPEVIENTLEVASKVETFSLSSSPIMPRYEIPEEFGTVEIYRERFSVDDLLDEFTTTADGVKLEGDNATKRIKDLGGVEKLYRIKLEADYLRKLTYDGAKERYPEFTPEITERIDFELNTIKTMGFPGYFLIVQDFVAAAKEKLGVWVGPGRGSAAGSVVAYCLKITNVDPFKYDLLFERFLNPDRISLPDIDIDFDNDGLSTVLDWVTEKYGKNSVAHIINYGKMATKSAIQDVCRVQEIPIAEMTQFKQILPADLEQFADKATGKAPKVNIKNIMKYSREVQKWCQDKPEFAEMMKYAEQLEGTVRQTGMHACGIIIAPDDLTNFVPLSTAKDKTKDNAEVLVTQYDGHVIENVGLIKMDFLALKTLSILKEAVANIKKSKGIDIDLDKIDYADPETFALFAKGNTIGIFQFESAGMRKYLRELKPTTLEDLIAMNALYRPGPMDYIPDFIDRKHGRTPIQYDIPDMEKYLKDTYGITVYQEQVMLLSRLLGGFTRGESDQLRKGMGKKIKSLLEELKPKFLNGGEKNGYDRSILEKIWADWEKFASYAFNKSHSTCYAILAYQTAYLKAHFPAEFMAANLTLTEGKITEVNKLMEEAKAMKIPVLLPDINESEKYFTVNAKGEIRFGFGGIKNVGDATIESIIAERKANGSYISIFDLLERVNLKTVNKKVIESLVLSGSLDSFSDIKREDYFLTETTINEFLEWGRMAQNAKLSSFNSLFGDEDMKVEPLKIKPAERWSELKRLNLEKDLIGMYLSAHPLDDYRAVIHYGCSHTVEEIKEAAEQMRQWLDTLSTSALYSPEVKEHQVPFTIGGVLVSAGIQTSQKGNRYGVFSLEDYSETIDLRLFDGYQRNDDTNYFTRYSKFLVKDWFVLVRGVITPNIRRDKASDKIFRQVDVNVTNIEQITSDTIKMLRNIGVDVSLGDIDSELLEEFFSLFRQGKGNVDLSINISGLDNKKATLGSRTSGVSLSNKMLQDLERLAELGRISFSINGKQYRRAMDSASEDIADIDEQNREEIADLENN